MRTIQTIARQQLAEKPLSFDTGEAIANEALAIGQEYQNEGTNGEHVAYPAAFGCMKVALNMAIDALREARSELHDTEIELDYLRSHNE